MLPEKINRTKCASREQGPCLGGGGCKGTGTVSLALQIPTAGLIERRETYHWKSNFPSKSSKKHLKSSWICVKGASNISNVWQETRELHPHIGHPCLQDTNRLCTLPAGVHWCVWRVQEGGCAHALPCDSITFPCKDTGLGGHSRAMVSSSFSRRPSGQEDTQTRAQFTFGEQLKCMPGTGRVVTYMVIQRYRYSVPTMQKNLLLMMDLETKGNRAHSVMELTLQAQRGSQGNTPSQPPGTREPEVGTF